MTAPAFLGCEVYVDGTRLADDVEAYAAGTPTVLADLSVTWGRENVVDQPDASTCSLTVADVDGDGDFLTRLHVGRPLEVYATGQILTGADGTDVVVDGGFEDAAIPTSGRVWVKGATSSVSSNVSEGARAIAFVTSTSGATSTVAIPPAPFDDDFASWDPIPSASPGDPWTVHLSVLAGPSQRVTFSPAMFTTPARGDGRPIKTHTVTVPYAPGSYTLVESGYVVPVGSPFGWVGARLVVTLGTWGEEPATWQDSTGSWADYATTTIDDFHVLAPDTATRRVLVFTGRITDLSASAYAGAGVSIAVTATDWTADLANDFVGDAPWAVETVADRVARILALSRMAPEVDVDASPASRNVSWVDVDSASVWDLLSELATTSDAVLWSAARVDRGFYLWFEDPTQRDALAVLAWDAGDGLVEITGGVRPHDAVTISACYLTRDDVTFTQDASDVQTIVDLTWQEQTVDDGGAPAPTERHVVVEDVAAIAEYGIRRLGYSTQLVNANAALDIADRVLARQSGLGWHADGLTWIMRLPTEWTDADRVLALDLLDATARNALPLVLTDMPAWTPSGEVVSTFLEGGTYQYEGGRWTLGLSISPSNVAGYSTTWRDLDDTWSWTEFDPTIAWADLWGVASAYASARWSQLDAHAWVDDPYTWAQYHGPLTGKALT